MRTDHTDDMVCARTIAAKREPWGPHSLALAVDLLVETERNYSQASAHLQGHLSNAIGFWRQVQGTAWYRPPPSGSAPYVPTDPEKAWKLVELRDLLMRVRRGDQI